MTKLAKTYTRIEAAEIFSVSNTIVARNLKAVLALGFDESKLIADGNRLTERAIELIGLYRVKDTAVLDAALAAESVATEAPATPATATVETAPKGLTPES